jgi:hypothetical protein
MIEEVEIFLNEDDFAEPFELTPPDGSLFVSTGNFINADTPQVIGSGVAVVNDSPAIEFATTKMTDVIKKTMIRRISTDEIFYVYDKGPDDHGFTTVKISRTCPQ